MRRRISIGAGRIGAVAAAGAVIAALTLSGTASSGASGGVEEPGRLLALQTMALQQSGLTAVEARHEIETQEAVSAADLVARLKAALGQSFAGVWFEPAAAKLHVGVLSPQARRTTEAVVEDAGLDQVVVETPVRWSLGRLLTAQEALNDRIGDLLARGEAATSLAPQLNAVKLELGGAVPPARRRALAGAAFAGVDPVMVVSGASHLGIARMARCGAFAENAAFCNPSIVAGVTTREEKIGPPCSIGPAVIRKEVKENTTETFVLTAGHCMSGLEDWFTSKKGVENLKKVGPALVQMNGGEVEDDVGLIEVENSEWKDEGLAPVKPTIAQWEAGKETEPMPVVGEIEPAVGQVSCLSGGASGTNCGVVKQVNLALGGLKELVEVREMTKTAKEGDSGGPWYVETEAGRLASGTMVGNRIVEKKVTEWSLFEPLAFSFEQFQIYQYDLQLLTTANETRAKCPMPGMFCFEAESYPATLTGSQAATQTFGFESGKFTCGSMSFTATLSGQSTSVEAKPSYGSCLFGFLAVTADVNECKYKFAPTSKIKEDSYKGTVDIVCSGKSMNLTASGGCTVTIGGQSALGTVEFVDTTAASPKMDVDVKLSISGMTYTEGTGCKFPGTRSNGTYTGELTLKADTAGGSAQGVLVSG